MLRSRRITPSRIRQNLNLEVSTRTIRSIFFNQGLKARIPRKKPRQTKWHKQQRLEWARLHAGWTETDWE